MVKMWVSSKANFYCTVLIWTINTFIVKTDGCSIECDLSVERICLDNLNGMVEPDCNGFFGCKNSTQPCRSDCPPENPVLSKDGLSCSSCDEKGNCQKCKESEFWCSEEGSCKQRQASCGQKCPSMLYPVLSNSKKECSPCPETHRWCALEEKCFHSESETCNGTCYSVGFRLCPKSKTCRLFGTPCDSLPQKERPKKDKKVKVPENAIKSSSGKLCNSNLDAALKTSNGSFYVFKGRKYWKLNHTKVATGYPKRISEGWKGLPGNLDAAVTWGVNGDSFFFKGNRYWKFTNEVLVSGYPKNISGWNGLPSNLDAALEWFDNEHLYFFKGPQYWKYSMEEKRVKPGYPKNITNSWPDIPNQIDVAFQWINNKIYFFKSGRYWRVDDAALSSQEEGPPYPRNVSGWWFGC